jgi:hypothetical protein
MTGMSFEAAATQRLVAALGRSPLPLSDVLLPQGAWPTTSDMLVERRMLVGLEAAVAGILDPDFDHRLDRDRDELEDLREQADWASIRDGTLADYARDVAVRIAAGWGLDIEGASLTEEGRNLLPVLAGLVEDMLGEPPMPADPPLSLSPAGLVWLTERLEAAFTQREIARHKAAIRSLEGDYGDPGPEIA